MMEFAASCGRAASDSLIQAGGQQIGLTNASIPAAVILTASPSTAPSLECKVDAKTGTLEIASFAVGRSQGVCAFLQPFSLTYPQ